MQEMDIRFHYEEVLHLKRRVAAGLEEHSLASTGSDGQIQPYSIGAHIDGEFAGGLTGKTFWGTLQISTLFVEEKFRGRGVGEALMEAAIGFGIESGLAFATVQTFDHQALDFYKRLGFEVEFTRGGYADGHSFHYLRLPLRIGT